MDRGLQADVDNLLGPLFEIVKHYQDDELERRTLFFTWVTNIFKPVSAVEVARILGYKRREVASLYDRLESSAFLECVDGGAKYRVVGPDDAPLYVRRDLIAGRQVTGRIPRFFMLTKRREVDVDALVDAFNQDGTNMWKHVLRRVGELAATLGSDYIAKLLGDYSFLREKIKQLLNDLREDGVIEFHRRGNSYSVRG